uniref:KIX domain-containing protein n=1 Tax=Angiostrongylus cantonensis TaxID=6313 RepID=A0A0K0DLM0_ANGCA
MLDNLQWNHNWNVNYAINYAVFLEIPMGFLSIDVGLNLLRVLMERSPLKERKRKDQDVSRRLGAGHLYSGHQWFWTLWTTWGPMSAAGVLNDYDPPMKPRFTKRRYLTLWFGDPFRSLDSPNSCAVRSSVGATQSCPHHETISCALDGFSAIDFRPREILCHAKGECDAAHPPSQLLVLSRRHHCNVCRAVKTCAYTFGFHSSSDASYGDAQGWLFTRMAKVLMGTLKEWHQEISRDLRDLVVGRLAKGILSSLDPIVTDDQRIHDAINIAQKVETATFELANNQEEYYHLLTQEICEFQRGRQDLKNSGVRADGGTGVTAGVAAGGCGAGKPHLQRNRNSGCSEFERGVCERNGSGDATLGLLLFTEVIVYLTAVVLWERMYEHTSQDDETESKRYTYCLEYFEDLPPEGISLSESPNYRSNMV